MTIVRRLAAVAVAGAAGCIPFPASSRAPTEVWLVLAPTAQVRANAGESADSSITRRAESHAALLDTWIVLDTTSFRPLLISPPRTTASGNRFAVVTSLQGSRYHPDVVRGIAESRDVIANAAQSVASLLVASSTTGLVLDFQEMTADDLPAVTEVSRAIADSARARGARQIGMIIPASDSTGYPGRALARIADALIVRIFPEHGMVAPAGPIVSPSWFARRLGARVGEVGVTRVLAGIPADGILWEARGAARRVTYAEAVRLVESVGVSLVRDPASGNLHAASSRDGWEIWVSDHQLIEQLIAEGRRIGVTRFALFGLEGADPQLWQSLP